MLFLFQLEIDEPPHCILIIDENGDLLARHGRQRGQLCNLRAVQIILRRLKDDISLAGGDLPQPQDDDGSDGDHSDNDDGSEDEQAHCGH